MLMLQAVTSASLLIAASCATENTEKAGMMTAEVMTASNPSDPEDQYAEVSFSRKPEPSRLLYDRYPFRRTFAQAFCRPERSGKFGGCDLIKVVPDAVEARKIFRKALGHYRIARSFMEDVRPTELVISIQIDFPSGALEGADRCNPPFCIVEHGLPPAPPPKAPASRPLE